jgi:predicted dehydrogenase
MGVIGYGYWSPNIVRNFHLQEGSRVVAVCDSSPEALKRVLQSYPSMVVTSESRDLLTSSKIDAVAIVTPVATHYELAKSALENGKHVFVEKPFTSTSAQAGELIELADRKKLKIMVDHTFLFTGAVKQIERSSVMGHWEDYYDSPRVNLLVSSSTIYKRHLRSGRTRPSAGS